MRVAMLTGGGDCPGLNAVIRAVVRKGERQFGDELIGFVDGWRGVIDGETCPLDVHAMRGTLPRGGTVLGSSRTNPFKIDGGRRRLPGLARAARHRRPDRHRRRRHARRGRQAGGRRACRWSGVPKTIDNDLSATEMTFGFDTAVQIATEAIDRLHTTAESHHRVMVCEVMGRHAGHIAVWSGIAGGATMILIPEEPFDIEAVCDALVRRHELGNYASIVVVAEGATPKEGTMATVSGEVDQFGHVRLGGIGQQLAEQIEARTGYETRVTILGHVQRGGTPDGVRPGAGHPLRRRRHRRRPRRGLRHDDGAAGRRDRAGAAEPPASAQPKLVDPALYHGVAEVLLRRLMELLTAAGPRRTSSGGSPAACWRAGSAPATGWPCSPAATGAMLSAILGALRVGIVPVVLNSALLAHERDALLADARPELDDRRRRSSAELLRGCRRPSWRRCRWPGRCTTRRARPGTPKGVWSGVLDEADAAGAVRRGGRAVGVRRRRPPPRVLAVAPLGADPLRRPARCCAGGIGARARPLRRARPRRASSPSTGRRRRSWCRRTCSASSRSTTLPPLASFRLLAHAGAPCPPPLKRRRSTPSPTGSVWEFYGSTEGQFTACPAADWLERPGHGRAGPARAPPRRSTTTAPSGARRRAHARFRYWDDPVATAAAGDRRCTTGDELRSRSATSAGSTTTASSCSTAAATT